MKKKGNKKPTTQSPKELSPSHKKKNIFNSNSKNKLEANIIALSAKKSKDKLFLPKKRKVPKSTHHKRTNSDAEHYIQCLTNSNNRNSKLSFIFRRKNNENKIKEIYSFSRNKNLKDSLNENKKSNNLLFLSFSLKNFRNNIMNSFSQKNIHKSKKKNKYNNIIKIKNKSLLNLDNHINIEDTRNTTSITGFNNSNLIYKKRLSNNKKQSAKSTKHIKEIKREKNQTHFSKNNSSKMISYTNDNEIKEKLNNKYNLHRYINKYNNIKTKNNNILNKSSNLILTKKSFRSTHKCCSKLHNNKKLSINLNPINESENIINLKTETNINRNECQTSINNNKKKKVKTVIKHKYKKRKTKSQENKYKIMDENNNEFNSVEEIHFIFVEIYQRKKAFFKKRNIDNIKDN